MPSSSITYCLLKHRLSHGDGLRMTTVTDQRYQELLMVTLALCPLFYEQMTERIQAHEEMVSMER